MASAIRIRASDHRGAAAMPPGGAARVQDLLRERADLPTGHPDRARLRERSIEAGLPLARRLANRYRGRGEPVADVYQQLDRTPTLAELAAYLDVAEPDLAIARDAWRRHRHDSLDALPAGSLQQPRPLTDTLGTVDGRLDAVIDWHTVQPLVTALPARQRRILALRHVGDLTQAEIATRVGLSQLHVSRLLERILTQLRTGILAEQSSAQSTGPDPRHCSAW